VSRQQLARHNQRNLMSNMYVFVTRSTCI
jgi:hypothetical protein